MKNFLVIVLAVAAGFPAVAAARPRITISIRQLREVQQPGKDPRLVPTKEASSGDVLEYELTYRNEGDEPALNALIEDPVPKGTTYLANSAAGANATITFSSDGGKTFGPPVKLTYEVKLPSGAVERRVATPSEYTNIRWTVARIAPGASGTVSFRVLVN